MSKVNWIKWSHLRGFPPPQGMAYIFPCENGVSIYCGDEMCVIEGMDVQECLDKLKATDDEITFKERVNMINKGE